MAVEQKRGCGYRKIGGLYLEGDLSNAIGCDRLPLPIGACPCCGGGLKVGRSYTEVNPFKFFGDHKDCSHSNHIRCGVCQPPDDVAYIILVGKQHYATSEDFIKEALTMGVSRRINHIPEKLQVGVTPIYLAHPSALEEFVAPGQAELPVAVEGDKDKKKKAQGRLLDAPRKVKKPAIFAMFIPRRVVKIVGEPANMDAEQRKAFEHELAKLTKQGHYPGVGPGRRPRPSRN